MPEPFITLDNLSQLAEDERIVLLGLAGVVSREVVRPMAPVSAFIWGLAVASHPEADPAALRSALLDCARGSSGRAPSDRGDGSARGR